MRSAADEIRSAIADSPDGAIPFEQYMHVALYGEHGFYTRVDSGRGAGRRRDFLTSPEVGPLFGAVISRMLDAEWERLGHPDPFVVVDVGAGPGTLARSVRAAAPACLAVMRYAAVEISATQRAMHPGWVESVATLDEAGDKLDGVVIANEMLDNVPFALAVFDGAWREAFVTEAANRTLVEVLSAPFEPVPDVLPACAPHGARAPLQRQAALLVAEVLARLRSGSSHVFDYARPTTAAVCDLDWREWLRTYRGHQRAGHYLEAPGSMDITCDVMIDQVPTPGAVRTQADFLSRWGIDELVESGRQAWHDAASMPTLEAIKMRSRVGEAEALLDATGLGGFAALEWAPPG